ncbi:hypothetical protein MRB53_008753 [Persea americana]|uniref:Uncharacterized protein n=1 Tax=Persea americana TaxID=3435 RepID=A0ACC2LM50_PERAE|nr:hypothetical protein MRB53_008753 [Persea americana]
MEKPRAPVAAFPPSPSPSAGGGVGAAAGSIRRSSSNEQRKAPPSPEELVAHYESQGVDPKEAPLKVIEDLQSVIIRVIGSGRGSKDKFMANTTRKLDNINTRLAVLDMKLDSKPGYPQALAIGVSAGATVGLLPYLATALAQMWDAVRAVGRRPSS